MALRSDLQAIVDALVASSAASKEVTLDALGYAIGTRAITSIEIDEMFAAVEASGTHIKGPDGGSGEELLKRVVPAARALANELVRPATVPELAARSGLSVGEVRHALTLLKIMQR